jgi:transposase
VVINPLLIANFSKLSLRKTKTDKKDAMTIAQFLLVHRDSITQLSLSQDLQDFRDIARERESVSDMISSHKVEIKRILQTTFPELENICNIDTRVMLDFIEEFPSARLVKTAKPRAIRKALQRKGVDTRPTYTAEDLIKTAKRSIATISPAKELIVQGKIRTLQHLLQRHDELTKILTEYCKSSMLEDLEIITSIDGISTGTATTFLAEIGCIGNYASHKNLIAFAGIDPTVYQSGKFEGAQDIETRESSSQKGHLANDGECYTAQQHIQKAFLEKEESRSAVQKSSLCSTDITDLLRVLTKQSSFSRSENSGKGALHI